MNSLAGYLLVASPHLGDGNFNKAVILILQHDEEGAVGLVLNRPTNNLVDEIWEQLVDQPCDTGKIINIGGPVEGPLMAIHTNPSWSENQILPGIHFSSDRDNLICLFEQQPGDSLRVFSGYSGWGASQLEDELEQGAWLTCQASMEHIFSDLEDDLWKLVAKEIGDDVIYSNLKIPNIPGDPSMN